MPNLATAVGLARALRRKAGFRTGAGLTTPGAWEGPKDVGLGWGNLKHVFSPGRDGIIYAIADDGILRWEQIRKSIRPLGPHWAPTGLISAVRSPELSDTHWLGWPST